MEILRNKRALLLPSILIAGGLAISGCGGGDTNNPDVIEPRDSSSNIKFFDVGKVDSFSLDTDVGYYEYTDTEGRIHICDIATNARGGTQGVGLSCALVIPVITPTTLG